MKNFKKTTLVAALGTTLTLSAMGLSANEDPVKLGLMLPYSGTYTALGEAITNGLKLAIEQEGGQLGGRDVEYVE
ncbi:MAG TPA: ABC transporter permease, partial [Halomonas sp.]|nr:ABC transporter permease [Halomonas sp.]